MERRKHFVENGEKLSQKVANNLCEYSQEIDEKGGLENLSFEEFKKSLVEINALSRHIKPENHFFDAKPTMNVGNNESAILPEFRERAFEEVFRATSKIENPLYRAAFLKYSINGIHAFEDGNGRTSRVVFSFLTGDFSKNSFEKLLGRGDDFSQNSYAERSANFENLKDENEVFDIVRAEILSDVFEEKIFKIGRHSQFYESDIFRDFKDNYENGLLKFNRILPDVDDIPPYKEWLSYDPDFIATLVCFDKIKKGGQNLKIKAGEVIYNGDAMGREYSTEDLAEIYDEFEQIKLRKIRVLADIFANPDNHTRGEQRIAEYLVGN